MSEFTHELASRYGSEANSHREWIHQHAELSFEEYETASYIRAKLRDYGITILPGFSGNSTVACIEGEEEGPVIAIRADIDALPVCEDNDLPYKSEKEGVMHACGHDAHAATLLGLCHILADHRELVKGKVKFIFQQAEEKLPGGARTLCEEGAIDDCDAVFAYHAISNAPLGTGMLTTGGATAAVGEYSAVITGKGGHGGMPHLSNNPIVCGTMIANAINQLVGTSVDPMKTGVVTVGYMLSGTENGTNIIPDDLRMGGNIRSFDNKLQKELYEKVEKTIKDICAVYGCDCEVKITKGYPSVENDAKAVSMMAEAFEEAGIKRIDSALMAGEDFSYYSLNKPSCIALLGFYDENSGTAPKPHHNPEFVIDAVHGIPIALEVMLNCYLNAAEKWR